jgi:anti-anti-sigma factor
MTPLPAPDPQRWHELSLSGGHPNGFDTQVRHESDRVVVAAIGELDIATCDALERRIAPLLTGHQHVVVDLSSLLFIDVAGMRSLLQCVRLAARRGVRLSIALGSDRVRRLFELCRMLDEFEFVYESLAAVPDGGGVDHTGRF